MNAHLDRIPALTSALNVGGYARADWTIEDSRIWERLPLELRRHGVPGTERLNQPLLVHRNWRTQVRYLTHRRRLAD